jgi:hypothetical protein
VADSIAPLEALVAQIGGGRWTIDGHCSIAVQPRFYVGTFTPERLGMRAARVGRRTVERFFRPVELVQIDTAGWHRTRLSWNAWYYDYGGEAHVDVFTRRVRAHTLALVFTYVGRSAEGVEERDVVLGSFQARR